jgi:hypothetical protein
VRLANMMRFSLLSAVGFACLSACNAEGANKGQLVISIATDMALPQQVDTINVQVQVHGQTLLDVPYAVGDRNVDAVPATLTLLAGKNASESVTVRVAGRKGDSWRTFREITTTIPEDRIAELRMPVQWLCDGTAQTVSTPDGQGGTNVRVLSTCDDGNTCIAGRCVPSTVDNATLPDYAPDAVFGGSDDPAKGSCFDTLACMIKGSPVAPDDHCTIAKPDGAALNVGLRVADDGICDSTNTICFVPLDGNSPEGWTLTAANDRIALPEAVCDKLASHLVRAVYVSTECDTKSESIPPCGDWSSVPKDKAITPKDDGSPAVPMPSVIASLLPSDGSAALCCPLLSDSDLLYTCVCSRNPTKTTLLAMDPLVAGSVNDAAELSVQLVNDATTVFNGALYWATASSIQRAPLAIKPTPTSFDVGKLQVFAKTLLLADTSNLYVLANFLGTTASSPVQLLMLDPRSGISKAIDTGGNSVVYQFDQDSEALYVARDIDAAMDAAASTTVRKSAVIRIAKTNGSVSTSFPEQSVTISNVQYGGYIGVRVDPTPGNSALVALFESALATDGTLAVEVQRMPLPTGSSGTSSMSMPADTLYTVNVDPTVTTLSLLGALDGAALLTRVDYDMSGTASIASRSSLLVIPPMGDMRIVADFVDDAPVDGLGSDSNYIYWLNSSGKLYRLSRDVLR